MIKESKSVENKTNKLSNCFIYKLQLKASAYNMLPRGVTNKLQLQYAREREPCLHLINVVSFPAVQFCEINKIVPYQSNARILHLNQTISFDDCLFQIKETISLQNKFV